MCAPVRPFFLSYKYNTKHRNVRETAELKGLPEEAYCVLG